MIFDGEARYTDFVATFLPPLLDEAERLGVSIAVENHLTVPFSASFETGAGEQQRWDEGVDTLAQIKRLVTELDHRGVAGGEGHRRTAPCRRLRPVVPRPDPPISRRYLIMGRLTGKVAVVTGAARGQGRSHAVTLAAEGADVVASDVPGDIKTVEYGMGSATELAETVGLVEALDRRCVPVEGDLRETAVARTVAERAMAEFGRIDILVCNAGVMSAADSTWELTDDQWDDMIDVNLTSVWKVCRAVVPHMIAGGRGGAITITGSVGGLRSVAGCTHYDAAKYGCIALMRTLAWELAPKNIRVNVIHPTGVNTEMSNNEWFGRWLNEHKDLAEPMRGNRMPVDVIQPEDVSKLIAFLVSDDARYITGVEHRVDAGFMIK